MQICLMRMALAMLLLAASGCVSSAVHTSAVSAQDSARILRAASVMDPRYSEADRASYERLWASHEAALAEIERASR